jgi:hypothetical protein
MVERKRSQTIWRLRVAYWISKTTRAQASVHPHPPPPHTHTHSLTHTHSHTEDCITYAFRRQQWYRAHVSDIACLVLASPLAVRSVLGTNSME